MIRSFTTERTGAAEAGRKGFRIRFRALPFFQSVSVLSVASVVKSGADVRNEVVRAYALLRFPEREANLEA